MKTAKTKGDTRITMTMKTASDVSGLSVRKLYQLIADRKLVSITVGRRRLVNTKSLTQLLARGA